jgi:uncharacterized protein
MVEGNAARSPAEGALAFTELASEDPHATERFLKAVFGWKFRTVPLPLGEYLAYQTPEGRGGVRPVRPNEAATSISYVQVRDLKEAQSRVERAGGTIVLPPVDLPGMGRFFWFRVPGGPLLACWQDLPAEPDSIREKRE